MKCCNWSSKLVACSVYHSTFLRTFNLSQILLRKHNSSVVRLDIRLPFSLFKDLACHKPNNNYFSYQLRDFLTRTPLPQ